MSILWTPRVPFCPGSPCQRVFFSTWPSTLVLRICVPCIPVFFTGPPKVRAVGDSANRGIGDADRVGELPSFFCPVSTFNFQLSTSDPPTPDPALPAIQPPISTIQCFLLNKLILVCYSLPCTPSPSTGCQLLPVPLPLCETSARVVTGTWRARPYPHPNAQT